MRNAPHRNPDKLFARAVSLHRTGDLDGAEKAYRAILVSDPAHSSVLTLLGTLCLQRGNAGEGIRLLHLSLIVDPQQPDACNNLGNGFKKLGRYNEALRDYDQAIALEPDFAEAHYNRASVLKKLGKYEEALHGYEKAIEFRPGYARAYNNRGTLLDHLGRHGEALHAFDKAIGLQADSAVTHNNRGNALTELRRHDEALICYDTAIAIDPAYAEAYLNKGIALQDMKRYLEALENYEQAIRVKPDYAEAHYVKGYIKILLGEWEEGWRLHEWRWKKEDMRKFARNFSQPLWLGGENLAGKTILLHAEQGFGDTVQFCRYVPLVEALGARVIVEVPAELLSLVSTIGGSVDYIAKGDVLSAFDFHCPLMSLPLAFGTIVETVPAKIPYLAVSPQKQNEWKRRLGSKTRPRIGLSWSGSGRYSNRTSFRRDINFADIQPLIEFAAEFISLQKEIRASDRGTLLEQSGIRIFDDAFADFSDTAALVAELDLVISVDTAVAHVAGALGRPVWLMLPNPRDFIPIVGREDNPWYPTACLFMQSQPGEWGDVVGQVIGELRKL